MKRYMTMVTWYMIWYDVIGLNSKKRDWKNCCSNYSPERHLWYTDFSKALSRLSSSGDYKRTQQEALTALLLYLYKLHVVYATTISTSPYVHTSTSCPITKATMLYTCALMSYSLISVIHMCTMCTPWGTLVPWHHL